MFTKFDCKKVSQEILSLTEKKLRINNFKPKVNILLTVDSVKQPLFESKIYVDKKLEVFKSIGIQTCLHLIDNKMKKEEIFDLIFRLNRDKENNGTFIQLPFATSFDFHPDDITEKIHTQKDIDGLNKISSSSIYNNDWQALKPATSLGICALMTYYDIKTCGKNVLIIGKGKLSGKPLSQMLSSNPFYSSVTNCDIFTKNLEDYCKNADILVSACGKAHLIKPENIKKGVVLIDVGINQIKNSNNKQTVVGDICPSSYENSSFYTRVPGGVGLLTLSSLAFNVLNACLLQKGIRQVNLIEELYRKEKFYKFIEPKKINETNKTYKVLVLSSAYNGLTQNIEKILKGMGHKVDFSLAKNDDQMRN